MKLVKFSSKNWLMIAQGILLIFLSYFLFSQSDKLLSTSSIIIGLIALFTGSVSIISYFSADKPARSWGDLLSGLFSCLAALFFLSGTALAHQLVSWFLVLYMTFNVILLVYKSWQLKAQITWWWISLLLLLYTGVIVYFFITATSVLTASIAMYTGVQFFVNGALIIVFEFLTRKPAK